MRTLRRETGQQMYTLVTSELLFTLTVVEIDMDTFVWSGTLIHTPMGKDAKVVGSELLVFSLYTLGFENRVAFNMLSDIRSRNPELAEEIDVLVIGMQG